MNRLECLSCASILLIDPSSVDTDYHYDVSLDSPIDDFADELYNKNEFMVKIFTDQLSSAHKPDCLWHSTCCKPELYGPVSETARTQLVKLNNTVKSMLLLPSKTPLASLSTPPSVSESPENPSFLPHISLPKDLVEKYGTKIDSIVSKITPMLDDPLPTDTFKRPRIQPSTSSPSLPNSSPVYTACVLALFGWIPQEISNLQYLKCNLCFRSIPLTCYSKLNKQKTKPHGSTSDGCTEHKDRNAVDNEGGSVDHLKSFDVIGNHRIYCFYADKSTDTTESNPFSSENQFSYYNSRVFQTLDRLSI